MRIAVITGASSGLGHEFAIQIDRTEQLDEIWVIARRKDRLEALTQEIETPLKSLSLDLSERESIEAYADLLAREAPEIVLLVNSAGRGDIGTYKELSQRDVDATIDINCRAAVDMTVCSLPYMKRGGRILQISSVASFMPLPGLGVYAASKSFLTSYSRSLRWELFGTGIAVTAVCPYWIKDTEFIEKAKQGDEPSTPSRAPGSNDAIGNISADTPYIRSFPFASKAKKVVRRALADSRINLPVSTPGLLPFLLRLILKFIPHEIALIFWQLLRRA